MAGDGDAKKRRAFPPQVSMVTQIHVPPSLEPVRGCHPVKHAPVVGRVLTFLSCRPVVRAARETTIPHRGLVVATLTVSGPWRSDTCVGSIPKGLLTLENHHVGPLGC